MIPPKACLGQAGLFPRLCFATLFFLVLGSFPSSAGGAEQFRVEVREVSGLARSGYPAHALLKLPRAVSPTTKFRLLHEGKPVVAQFRPDREGTTAQWWLDFQTAMAPEEKRVYTVEFGDDVPAGPERKGGHKLTEAGGEFRIANAPYITWAVPRDLKGLLRSVDFPPLEFLQPDSPGLLLRDRQGREHRFSGSARILRQGSMAVALRFEKPESQASLRDVRSTVDLTFPAPVSWVEVDWNLDDPRDNVAAVGLQLHLRLAKAEAAAPTLVDFGATSTVYTWLRQGQEAELSAGPTDTPPWKVLRGDAGRLMPLAKGMKQSVPPRAEGWAHIMDRKNCLALAVDAFGRNSRDRISATGEGTVTVWREYPRSRNGGSKRLRCWLHFVFFPPQYSATASPQQMQTPLEVRQIGR
jgi:hypothetical protein